jgi:hypothetical protein
MGIMENVVGPAGACTRMLNVPHELRLCVTDARSIFGLVGRYGHSGEVFGSDKMFVFGGVGDASVYRDDLWFFYVGTTSVSHNNMRVDGWS